MIRTDTGRDIVDELRGMLDLRGLPTGNSDINVMVRTVSRDLLERAIAEIQYLRGMAGAVTKGESFRDIKQGARLTIAELEAILKEDDRAVTVNPDGTVTPV